MIGRRLRGILIGFGRRGIVGLHAGRQRFGWWIVLLDGDGRVRRLTTEVIRGHHAFNRRRVHRVGERLRIAVIIAEQRDGMSCA